MRRGRPVPHVRARVLPLLDRPAVPLSIKALHPRKVHANLKSA